MKKLIRIIHHHLLEIKWSIINLIWLMIRVKNKTRKPSSPSFTIGIGTYKERYQTFLIPLIERLTFVFPDTPIIIAVNGYHNHSVQKVYLKQIEKWVEAYQNVSLITFIEPQGLGKLWNQIIVNSPTDKVFLLNDDVNIAPNFKKQLFSCDILNSTFGIINKSYSHFMIDKTLIEHVGWFDERFPGIGYEDHDIEIRMVLADRKIDHFNIPSIKNEHVIPKDWSFNQEHGVILSKYSKPNEDHYFKKWEFSDTKKEGFTFVRITKGYARLKEGMETPDFYNKNEFNTSNGIEK